MVKKILVPIDGSPTSQEALVKAVNLARGLNAEITIINVTFTPEAYFAGYTFPHGIQLSHEDSVEGGRQVINEALENVEHENIKITKVVEPGNPPQVILDYAEEVGIDLIVIGSIGHNPLASAFFGSVTQRVLLKAKCPVLVVKPNEA
ncbi:MAG: hypothetical protein APF84_08280 [Gracilibacter sp. BRH_c7a]|nr:MAG: hypothetical protein APF84_08280 [Gracilibacter sp. BRH_c7a]